MRRACLDCGTLSERNRCKPCQRVKDRAKNNSRYAIARRDPAYRAYAMAVKGANCGICGKPGADTVDHIYPLALGGSNDPSNWQPAHRACNSGKGMKV